MQCLSLLFLADIIRCIFWDATTFMRVLWDAQRVLLISESLYFAPVA